MTKKRAFQALKTFLPLALGVFFIYYSYRGFTPEERHKLYENISQVNPKWIFLALAGGLLSHLSRAYRWKLMINPMGYKLRFSTAFMSVMAGYLANLGIPRSGEVLRGATAATYEDIPFEKVFGTIIAERAVDIIIVLCIVVLTIFIHTTELLALFDKFQINPWVSLLGLLILIFLGVGALKLVQKSKLSLFVKIRGFVSGILEGVKSIFNMDKPLLFIFHTLFIWATYIMTFYILKFAFPGLQEISFSSMLVAFVVGSFSISITNGGIGLYPIAVGGALTLFGVAQEAGEAFGWVDWGLQTLINIVFGGLSLLLLPVLIRKQNNEPKQETKNAL